MDLLLVQKTIYDLTSNESKSWRKLLAYGKTLDIETKRLFLWFWPSVDELLDLHKLLQRNGIINVLSIGCGNGLLEWLLKESGELSVYGLEIDRNWWRSAYSIRQFIDLNFVDAVEYFDAESLRGCCKTENWQFALLFCYFNNHDAFLQYLRLYEGDVLLIIGPQSTIGIHSDPEPLQPNISAAYGTWSLCETLCFAAENVLALYKRLPCQQNGVV